MLFKFAKILLLLICLGLSFNSISLSVLSSDEVVGLVVGDFVGEEDYRGFRVVMTKSWR